MLWAHSGFERPEKIREMLRRYPTLWCDLAFLTTHASNGKVAPGWRELFIEFPDRFVVSTDTFTPERWHYIVEHANFSRAWLADLPRDLAERIGYRNADALIEAVIVPETWFFRYPDSFTALVGLVFGVPAARLRSPITRPPSSTRTRSQRSASSRSSLEVRMRNASATASAPTSVRKDPATVATPPSGSGRLDIPTP